MRRLSPYLTRALLRTRLSANGVTWLMLPAGLGAAALISLRGVGFALCAVLLIQVQVLLDCSDGEVARWRQQFDARGIYVDRLAHYVTETAFPVALGVRADGGWDAIGGWTTLGLVVAVLVLLIRTESALVTVARAETGRRLARDTAAVAAPRGPLLRRARAALSVVPFFRAFVATEASLLALAASVVDGARGDLGGSHVLLAALLPVAAITAAGHLLAILTSSRLR